jgi:LSD1 subclass zinc finger protein
MPRISCSSCDTVLKIPDDGRADVRCPACGVITRLKDEPPQVEVVLEPIREARPFSKSSPPRRPAPRKKAHPLWFLPLITILPPCLVLFILTPFSKLAACLALLIGTCVVIFAVIKIVLLYRRKNLTDLNDTLPWFLRGGAAQIISHVYHAFQYPKTVGVWVAIELFTILMTITGGVFFMIHKDPVPPNPFAERMQAANNAEAVLPPSVTGDATLDKALADLSGANTVNWQVTADQLPKMKPDKNRAIITQKLAERATTSELFPRVSIIRALGVWATPAEVPVLIDAMHDENNLVRSAAIESLAKTHDPQAVAPLVRAFVDGTNRFEAESALKELGPIAEKKLLPVLEKEQEVFLRLATVNLLKEIGTQESLPALREMIAEDNVHLKSAAQDPIKAINARRRGKGN